jgi:hypothetical protein
MTTRIVVVAVLVAVAVVVALLAQRRRPAAPTNPGPYTAPAQLDRDDFGAPAEPWLVVVFTSSTCDTCAEVWSKAEALRSGSVAVVEVEAARDGDLQRRYEIDAVPITVIADAEGVVQRSFIGPVSSTHLWAAVAEVREPGSVPDGCTTGDEPEASPDTSG